CVATAPWHTWTSTRYRFTPEPAATGAAGGDGDPATDEERNDTDEARHPPAVCGDAGHVLVWQHLCDADHPDQLRAPHRGLQRLPPLLHRQPAGARRRRSGGEVRAEVRPGPAARRQHEEEGVAHPGTGGRPRRRAAAPEETPCGSTGRDT